MGDDEMDMSTDETGGMDEGGMDEGGMDDGMTGMEMGEPVDPGPTVAESSMPFAPTEVEGFEGGGGEGSDSGTAAPATVPHAPGAESGGGGGQQEESAGAQASAGEDFGGGKPDYFSATERGLTSAFKGGPLKEPPSAGSLDDVAKQQFQGMGTEEQAPGQADVPSPGSDVEGDQDTAGVDSGVQSSGAGSQSSGAAAELADLQRASSGGGGSEGGAPSGAGGGSEGGAPSGAGGGSEGGGASSATGGGSSEGSASSGGDVDSGASYGGSTGEGGGEGS